MDRMTDESETDVYLPYDLWAKKDNDSSIHLLEYHLIDCASVVQTYLDGNPIVLGILSDFLGLNPEKTVSLMAFLSSLHDLGKVNSIFQEQSDIVNIRHTILGMSLLKDEQIERTLRTVLFGESGDRKTRRELNSFMRAVFMHHGKPCGATDSICRGVLHEHITEDELSISSEIIDRMRSLYCSDQCYFTESIDMQRVNKASLMISGLISLSDWISSDRDNFPYCSEIKCLSDYAVESERRAIGLFNGRLSPLIHRSFKVRTDFKEIFGFEPSDMQNAVLKKRSSFPSMVILEDATGSGKTEAAISWAINNIHDGLSSGITFALPTRATTNLMFARMKQNSSAFLDESGVVTLIHGDVQSFFKENEGLIDEVELNSWFNSNRFKRMFSNLSVCTVDQILLASTFSRYEPLRLLSLIGKSLIIDEVHSYDAYTFGFICSLLVFCRTYRIPVMLMSATLPLSMRRKLIESYCGQSPELTERYPLITVCSDEGCFEHVCEKSERTTRDINIMYDSNRQTLISEMVLLASEGMKVCWICNTVDDAIGLFDSVSDSDLYDSLLIHSRFTSGDRTVHENELFERCGKGSVHSGGFLVVSTQVVEQSMDISFDRIYSDLAPADALFQRMGRDQRFPGSRIPCEFVICGPEIVDEPDGAWYSDMFPRASHVYLNHYSLWKTAELLHDRMLCIPADYREVIEAVYSEPGSDSPFISSYSEYMKKCGINSSNAHRCGLRPEEGYDDPAGIWDKSNISTRLSNDDTESVLLISDGAAGMPISGTVDNSIVQMKKKYTEKLTDCSEHTNHRIMKVVRMRESGIGVYDSDGIIYSEKKGLEYV